LDADSITSAMHPALDTTDHRPWPVPERPGRGARRRRFTLRALPWPLQRAQADFRQNM